MSPLDSHRNSQISRNNSGRRERSGVNAAKGSSRRTRPAGHLTQAPEMVVRPSSGHLLRRSGGLRDYGVLDSGLNLGISVTVPGLLASQVRFSQTARSSKSV